MLKTLKELEEIITKNSSYKIPIIAKIEKPEAVKNIDSIITACDGLMVARGDLGVEIPAQEVPLIQKQLVRRAKAGKNSSHYSNPNDGINDRKLNSK